jgi:hypothetical protein
MLRLCRVENAAELRTAVGRSGACLAESPLERRELPRLVGHQLGLDLGEP